MDVFGRILVGITSIDDLAKYNIDDASGRMRRPSTEAVPVSHAVSAGGGIVVLKNWKFYSKNGNGWCRESNEILKIYYYYFIFGNNVMALWYLVWNFCEIPKRIFFWLDCSVQIRIRSDIHTPTSTRLFWLGIYWINGIRVTTFFFGWVWSLGDRRSIFLRH